MTLSHPKLSETLVEFVKPILNSLGNDASTEEHETVLEIGVSVWNATVYEALEVPSSAQVARERAEFLALGGPLLWDHVQGRRWLEELERRKLEQAPKDLRLMGEPDLVEEPDGFNLRLGEMTSLASEFPEPSSEEEFQRAYDDELRKLAVAAREVRKLQPWNWMGLEQRFGIVDPYHGGVDWVVVTGGEAGQCGFAVFRYDLGGEHLERLAAGETGEPDPDLHALSIRFVDKEELEAEDLELYERAGVSFEGPAAWPLAGSELGGENLGTLMLEELHCLRQALEHVQAVATRALMDPAHVLPDASGRRLIRRPTRITGEITWKDERGLPPDLGAELAADDEYADDDDFEEFDRERAARLRREIPAQRGKLECDFTEEIDEAKLPDCPREPVIAVFVEADSGLVVHTAVRPLLQFDTLLPNGLLAAIERRQARPNVVLVNDPEVADALEPAITSLGIRLKLVESLPAADRALFAVEQAYGIDPE